MNAKDTITAHFVTFLSPGTFFHEDTTKPIESWSIEEAQKMSKEIKERHGAVPFCFYFTTQFRGPRDLNSKQVAKSGRYFLGGRLLDVEGVKREIPDCRILVSNMESNGWKQVVVNENSWRTIQPFEKDDVLL